MTSTLRRAGGFAAVGSFALAAPALGRAAAAPFAIVALLAAFVVDEGSLFELFARPGDRRDGRLNGLAGFALAATALALLSTLPGTNMPTWVFVSTVLVVAYGNLGSQLAARTGSGPVGSVAGFVVAGLVAGVAGRLAVAALLGGDVVASRFVFLAASGALAAALLRSVLYERDDPVVLLSVGFLLWLFDTVAGAVDPATVAVALAVTVAFGYASYVLGTASIPGMLTGVLLGLLTIVFGGFGWFAVLITFFGLGGLAAKYKYETKRQRGVAEDNHGARGSGNVLGNAAVALVAVIGFAAGAHLPVSPSLFQLAFAGSVAAAMSDTLSSEIGGLYDRPRLITTLDPVPPGTDGGVTWQGELAGVVGAALVAGVAVAALPFDSPSVAAAVVVGGGVAGMTTDSLLGAMVEGGRIGNQAVNFLATFAGAVASVVFGAALL